jgi:hypothetical protein
MENKTLDVYFELILKELDGIKKFPTKKPYKDKTRKNVLHKGQDSIQAFTLGKVRAYHSKIMVNSTHNKKYKNLLNLLTEAVREYDPEFIFTTIQINKNVLTPPHKDKNNVGLSLALSLGNFKGGGIEQFNDDGTSTLLDTHNCFQYQDGSKLHRTLPYLGDRYAMIFFFHKAGFNSPMSPPKETILMNGMSNLNLGKPALDRNVLIV